MKRDDLEAGAMVLMNDRKAWDFPPFKKPEFDRGQRIKMRLAATDYATANHSDPFAYGRAMMHMIGGLDSIGDVAKEAGRVLAARTAAHRAREEAA